MRQCTLERNTNETQIKLGLNLDGKGEFSINTGCGFFNHMLELFTRHGRFDLDVTCNGDVEVDYHHTVEDIGIALGKAFNTALGEKRGIKRYGDIVLPMDEALIQVAVDISGRTYLNYKVDLKSTKVGDFDTELVEEFLWALSREAGLTLHVIQLEGTNTHHIIEGVFKALARVLSQAVSIDERFAEEIPSTKGVL